MDNIKIGNFIRECRKEKGLTQQQLADKLFIEAKTISKWETGNGIPDVSLMSNLCNELGVTLNELFLGEHITNDEKEKEIEKLILETFEKEKRINKKNLKGEILIGISLIIVIITLVLLASLIPMKTNLRIIVLVIATITMIIGIAALVILDANIGYYECNNCHERFMPTIKEYVFGPHTLLKRRLYCPKCGKSTWCKKRISKN